MKANNFEFILKLNVFENQINIVFNSFFFMFHIRKSQVLTGILRPELYGDIGWIWITFC